MDLRLDGRVALITGGGRGIGAAVAEAFAGAGAKVGIVDIDPATAEATARGIQSQGGEVAWRQADVTDKAQIDTAAAELAGELGPINVLVACAAIDEAVPVSDLSIEQWRRMIDVNLTGVFLSVQAVLPAMRERRDGRIVLMGSSLTDKGGIDLSHYCAAKGGVHAWARTIAREVIPDGVTVNVVAPGPVETEMLRSLPADWLEEREKEMPIGRFAEISEVVPTIQLLASDAGAYYVGATMNVSGGDLIP